MCELEDDLESTGIGEDPHKMRLVGEPPSLTSPLFGRAICALGAVLFAASLTACEEAGGPNGSAGGLDSGSADADVLVDAERDAGVDAEADASGDTADATGADADAAPLPDVSTLGEDRYLTVEESQEASVELAPASAGFAAEIVEQPRRGQVSLDGARLTYAAGSGYNGYDVLRFRVSDASGAAAEADLHITIYETLDGEAPMVELPRHSIEPWELAVVVNELDDLSVDAGAHYADARGIPQENVVSVSLDPASKTMSADDFAGAFTDVEAALPDHIQAFVLTWVQPFRVECMSITSAFALGGYDDAYCNTSGGACSPTGAVDYFGSSSTRPFDDHGIRPAMMLAAESDAQMRELVDRGVSADHTFPPGTGYLVRTTDEPRSVRWSDFAGAATSWESSELDVVYVDNADGSGSNLVRDTDDVLFYLTGLTRVDHIDTNTYRPGAVADHLTSYGGDLTGGGQMSILRWLEAGATASYGTAVEPCNYTQKFPRASVLIDAYFRGRTVLEAYWQSVHWPGEGVFVGEPLARPFGRSFLRFDGQTLTIETTTLDSQAQYVVLADGDVVVDDIAPALGQRTTVTIDQPDVSAVYELREATQ
jgi:uncharacterized protein (TIGR03790 family)